MKANLFVYGTLQPGERLYHEIKEDVTDAQEAILRDHKLIVQYARPFPGITPAPGRQVHGWLLSTDLDTLEKTDRLEGHPAVYRRTLVIVRTQDDNIPHPAWTYVYSWPKDWQDFRSEKWSSSNNV